VLENVNYKISSYGKLFGEYEMPLMTTLRKHTFSYIAVALIGLALGFLITVINFNLSAETENNASYFSFNKEKYLKYFMQKGETKEKAEELCHIYLKSELFSRNMILGEYGIQKNISFISDVKGVGFYPDEYYCSAIAAIEDAQPNGAFTVAAKQYYYRLNGGRERQFSMTFKEVVDQKFEEHAALMTNVERFLSQQQPID
jgi:hypothetical protein